MVQSILCGILGLLFLVGAFRQYRCRGGIWSAEYIAASPKEKKKMRSRRTYYLSATACLLTGLSFALLTVYTLTEMEGFAYAVCVLVVLLFPVLVLGGIGMVRKGMIHGTDRAVHRLRLEEEYEENAEADFRNKANGKPGGSRKPKKEKSKAEESKSRRK